jgi:UDP-2-acetamido-2,6-beta-L-arabino-hexul-4-ose reductase
LKKCYGTEFISVSHPGVRRGEHYHFFKTEVFTVLSGKGVIYTRNRYSDERISYACDGDAPNSIIIRPGIVHAIENVGPTDMILLVQSDMKFNPTLPDTYQDKI